MKKYKITEECKEVNGTKLFRIKAIISFGDVGEGELGGYIEKEGNLSQEGNAWVYGDARVYGNALVRGNAWVYGNAQVYGDALVRGDARVYGNAQVYGDARVYGNALVRGDARVYGNAWVRGNARVYGNAQVYGDAQVYGNAQVCRDANYAVIKGFGSECRSTTFYQQKDGSIGVKCGCFNGTLEEFREKVCETHGESKFAKEYLMIADLMEMHFAERSEKDGSA